MSTEKQIVAKKIPYIKVEMVEDIHPDVFWPGATRVEVHPDKGHLQIIDKNGAELGLVQACRWINVHIYKPGRLGYGGKLDVDAVAVAEENKVLGAIPVITRAQ